MKLAILFLLIAYAYAQGCPPANNIDSANNPDDFSIDGSLTTGEPITLILRPPAGNSVSKQINSNDPVLISASFDPKILVLRQFSVETKFASKVTLTVTRENGQQIVEEDDINPSPANKLSQFNFNPPITNVVNIELSAFSPTGELGLRNLFIAACVPTGLCTWSPWSSCSETCGPGEQDRNRACECPNADPDRFICVPGGPLDQTQVCEIECCEVPPTLTSWEDWGPCSEPCGPGTRDRSRECIRDDECPDDNTDCDGAELDDTENCNLGCCEKPPTLTSWSDWGSCSETCGPGQRTRTRECVRDEDCPDDNVDCDGAETSDSENCEIECCQVPPSVGQWGEWGGCSATCGTAFRERRRECIQDEDCPDNTECTENLIQSELCDLPCCEIVLSGGLFSEFANIGIAGHPDSAGKDPTRAICGVPGELFMVDNRGGKEFLIVQFTPPDGVLIIDFTIRIKEASSVTFTYDLATGVQEMETIDTPRKTFKTIVPPQEAITGIRIDFEYRTGELAVSDLCFTICEVEQPEPTTSKPPGEACVCRVRGDPILEPCSGDLMFLSGETEYLLASSDVFGCVFDVKIETEAMGPNSVVIPVTMTIDAYGYELVMNRDHELEVDGNPVALPWSSGGPNDISCDTEENKFLVCTVGDCKAQFGFWGEQGMSEGVLVIPQSVRDQIEGECAGE